MTFEDLTSELKCETCQSTNLKLLEEYGISKWGGLSTDDYEHYICNKCGNEMIVRVLKPFNLMGV